MFRSKRTSWRLLCWNSLVILLLMAVPSPAKAFDPLSFGIVSYFVGKGLIKEAKEAVKQAIDDLDGRLKKRIEEVDASVGKGVDQFGNRLDGSIRLAGEEARASLREAERILNEAIDRTKNMVANERREFFRNLAEERKQFFADLDIRIAKIEGFGNALVDRFDLAAGELLRKAATEKDTLEIVLQNLQLTPFTKKNFGLHHLYGGVRQYKVAGEYDDFKAVGLGFGGEGKVALEDMVIQVNGRTVDKEHHRFGDKAFTRVFSVPVESLNSCFLDRVAMPVNVHFESKDIKLDRSLVLLPKFPIRYRLFVHFPGNRTEQLYVLSAGADFLDHEVQLARARAKKDNVDEKKATRLRLGDLTELIGERLPFGSFAVQMPQGWESYSLEVEWFNGDRATLHSSKTAVPGALGVKVSTTTSARVGYMTIDVDLPRYP